MKDFLNQLLFSLGCIEVKGKENLDTLLGCILAIEQQIASLDAESEDTDGR